jgi:hypothetical protein
MFETTTLNVGREAWTALKDVDLITKNLGNDGNQNY